MTEEYITLDEARRERVDVENPAPLLREIPPGTPYPVDALGSLQKAAEAIHDITQAPDAIGAQSVLGVAALAAQALGDAETLHGRAPTSLYLLTVAQTGERKSSCDRLAMEPVQSFTAELAEAYRDEKSAYQNQLEIWETQRKAILNRAKSNNGDFAKARLELDALGPEPDGPLSPTIIATEPTFEGLTKNLSYMRAALGIFSDEGGAFIGGHAMNSDNRLKTMAGLSALWDGSPVNRTRAGDGVQTFHGRRLSAHLMAQPVAATELLSDPIANGQGFLARFLLTEPPSTIGSRLRVGHDPQSEAALATFAARIGSMLRQHLPLKEKMRNELEPPLVRLTSEARRLLQEFALTAEREQANGGKLDGVRPFASKAAEHAARIAAVLALFADPDARQVSAETMQQAVTLADFYLSEAARLSDAAIVSPETREAERMRRWLLESWREEFISASDAAQRGPFKETKRARSALQSLEQYGWVVPVQAGAKVMGHNRQEAWRVVRGARI